MVYFREVKLVLEDGQSFYGYSFGAEKGVSGEVVFNTGMTGYPEALTDPSYKGQILALTYPLIGNYGIPEKIIKDGIIQNFESDKIQIEALIVSEYCEEYSHWNAKKSLGDWLKENNIPGIFGIDTRMLTKKLREHGTMLGKIVFESDIPLIDPNKQNLVDLVSCKKPLEYGNGSKTIILIDCGIKSNIIRSLLKRNLRIIQVPWNYDFTGLNYDGVFMSNGPGDPKMCTATIEIIKKVMKKNIPIMGICLGNQILALAAGADTYKLKYGHRSQNQPCIEVGTKKCYITSQNHGFAVDEKTLPKDWEVWFSNANDGTCEGIRHKNGLFKSCQFHPESSPGPTDTEFLFDEFMEMIGGKM